MGKPLLLDLFCGAGGCSVGYARAGFKTVGCDLSPMPNYPFPFIQADALELLSWLISSKKIRQFAAVHASPPCQGYTTLQQGTNKGITEHPLLIEPVRELLEATGLSYVMENVPSAPLRPDLLLCGEMFGLGVIRHRKFESNVPMIQPIEPKHRGRVSGTRHGAWYAGPYFAVYGKGGGKGSVAEWQGAMGIDWTDVRREIAEAIPPAFTEYVGGQLLRAL